MNTKPANKDIHRLNIYLGYRDEGAELETEIRDAAKLRNLSISELAVDALKAKLRNK